jgi:hypothetical protein
MALGYTRHLTFDAGFRLKAMTIEPVFSFSFSPPRTIREPQAFQAMTALTENFIAEPVSQHDG